MPHYNWNDPSAGAAAYAAQPSGPGGGGLSGPDVQALITDAITALPTPINLQDVSGVVADAIDALPAPTPALGTMVYRGGYSNTAYHVGDVVVSGGKQLACRTAYTASAAGVVGTATVVYPASGTVSVALPAGSAAGNLVLMTYQMGAAAGQIMGLGDLLAQVSVAAAAALGLQVWAYTLTASDITAGSLTLPDRNGTKGNFPWGVALSVVAGAVVANPLALVTAQNWVDPQAVVAGAGLLYHFCFGASGGSDDAVGSCAALSNVVSSSDGPGLYAAATGIESYTGGVAPASHTWTWNDATSSLTGYRACGSIALSAGIDLTKWDVLSGS